jgi:hypothetical protein
MLLALFGCFLHIGRATTTAKKIEEKEDALSSSSLGWTIAAQY